MKNRIISALSALALMLGVGIAAAPPSQAVGYYACKTTAQVEAGYPVEGWSNLYCSSSSGTPKMTVKTTLYRNGEVWTSRTVNIDARPAGSFQFNVAFVSSYGSNASWYTISNVKTYSGGKSVAWDKSDTVRY